MNPTEVRQKIHQQIDQLPSDLLLLVIEFLDFLNFKQANATDSAGPSAIPNDAASEPTLSGSTAADLIRFSGTWQGDDLDECLQAVYDNRSPAQF